MRQENPGDTAAGNFVFTEYKTRERRVKINSRRYLL
jgi:hypothetical protein